MRMKTKGNKKGIDSIFWQLLHQAKGLRESIDLGIGRYVDECSKLDIGQNSISTIPGLDVNVRMLSIAIYSFTLDIRLYDLDILLHDLDIASNTLDIAPNALDIRLNIPHHLLLPHPLLLELLELLLYILEDIAFCDLGQIFQVHEFGAKHAA